jgi:hypothetical protein
MDKIEALKSVGAEQLIDLTRAKIIQSEVDRLQQHQARLRPELERFEREYQMSSEESRRKFEAGELGDAVEFLEWASLYEIYLRDDESLRLLKEKLR